MASSLTSVGIVWACFSLTAALTSCVAFYLPYWIQGRLTDQHDTFFGSFRRCNFLSVVQIHQGVAEIVEECGRYNGFGNIPSLWWQVSTILIGTGCSLSLLVAAVASAGCCFSYVLTKGSARIAGSLQLIAVFFILFGAVVYPIGWYAAEVKEACGATSGIYNLGSCQLSWSTYLMGGSVSILLLCSMLSVKASHIKRGSVRLMESP